MATASVLTRPSYYIDYDDTSLQTLGLVSAIGINAYTDDTGDAQNLTIGASRNVNVEAVDGVNLVFNSNNNVGLWNYVDTNGVITSNEVLKIHSDSDNTYISASNRELILTGADSNSTTTVSKTTFTETLNYQVVTTTSPGMFLDTSVVVNSNLQVTTDIVGYQNIVASGNVFSSTVNWYKNYTPSSSNNYKAQTAYGMYINDFDQLEIIKFEKFGTSNISTSQKRVGVYGTDTGSTRYISDVNSNQVIAQFNNIFTLATTGNYTIGYVDGYTNNQPGGVNTGGGSGGGGSDWTSFSNDIYIKSLIKTVGGTVGGVLRVNNNTYVMSNLGVGTATPSAPLHVVGQSLFGGALVPTVDVTYDLGTSNARWRDLFLSGNTINLGGTKIGLDANSNVAFKDASDNLKKIIVDEIQIGSDASTPLFIKKNPTTGGVSFVSGGVETTAGGATVWATWSTNVYLMSSNVGIGKSNAAYALDVNGAVNAVTYCNLFETSLTSTSAVKAATASNLTLSYNLATSASNVAYATSNYSFALLDTSLTSTSAVKAATASNLTVTYNLGVSASNRAFGLTGTRWSATASNIYIGTNSNVGIGTTTPAYPLHVVGAIYATGDITAFSDIRVKDNLVVIDSALDKLSQLSGYTYTRTDFEALREAEGTKHMGLIAQEVKEVLPEIVVHDANTDMYAVNYGSMAAVFVEAVKELSTQVAELKAKVDALSA
jgi:hypothetical protein